MRLNIILFLSVLGLLTNGCSNDKVSSQDEVKFKSKVHTQDEAKSERKVDAQNKIKIPLKKDVSTSMATIPAGSFMMGCNASIDSSCSYIDNETPYHKVEVPEYKIDLTEVTVGQYRACVKDDGSCSKPSINLDNCNWSESEQKNHPINCINWYEAKAYCEWAGKRLCSEAEWEKAARGTDGRIYPWGNERATCKHAVMRQKDVWGCGKKRTWPVGSKPPGVYGIYDMAGNVAEWIEDDWHWGGYEGAPDDGTAWISEVRSSRGVRGGNFIHLSVFLRVSGRRFFRPEEHFDGNIGIRCCYNVP